MWIISGQLQPGFISPHILLPPANPGDIRKLSHYLETPYFAKKNFARSLRSLGGQKQANSQQAEQAMKCQPATFAPRESLLTEGERGASQKCSLSQKSNDPQNLLHFLKTLVISSALPK